MSYNHMIDNNLNELNSIDFIIPRPGRAGTISCVRFVMVGLVDCVPQTKTFRIIICIKGHHFIRETLHIINKLENHLASQCSNSLFWPEFYEMFELQVRVWSGVSDHLLILHLITSRILMTL